jgi:hypothetical protein
MSVSEWIEGGGSRRVPKPGDDGGVEGEVEEESVRTL